MIQLTNVYKEYKLDGETFTALNNITLSIKESDFISIAGPSGCGKSTLMHLIGLLDAPTRGNISVLGKKISNLNDGELSKLRNEFIGFVFQQFNLINKLNVIENILLPTIYNRKKPDFNPKKRALELMTRFCIETKGKSYPNKLSGGQQQRVAIARALINKPKLILADEPTGNLDSKTGEKIIAILKELNTVDKITVVVVTHDTQISRTAKRQIRMFDGEIIK